MSDTATEPTTTETVPPEATAAPVDDTLGDPGKRALEAERKARRAAEKAAADSAAKVKEYEDAQKSEAERLAAQLQAAEDRAAKAEAKALRQSIVSEFEIPDLAEFLSGDEITMRAQAEKLKARTAPAKQPPTSAKPVENLQPGSGHPDTTGPTQLTRTDLQGMKPEQIEAARVAGQLNTLLGIR